MAIGSQAIRVKNLSKRYRIGAKQASYKTLREAVSNAAAASIRGFRSLYGGFKSRERDHHIWALKDVSFEIGRGEVTGIVGRNGAGKTTILRILSRITEPTSGYADVQGRVGSLLEVGTGFHPELTGRENVYLNGVILGMKRREIDRKFDEIVCFSEVERFLDTPMKRYSSGMQMRLAFAVAAHLEPEILLVDEVLAVGDVAFQKKCLGKMEAVAQEGRTVLFVSHNMGAIRSLCNQGIFLDQGGVGHQGGVSDCIEAYFKAVGAFSKDQAGTDPESGRGRFGVGLVSVNAFGGHTVQQGEPLEFSTTIHAPSGAVGFSLHCVLEDMQGRRILRLRTESASLGWEQNSQEPCAVEVKIPPLWLNPGMYTVFFILKLRGDVPRAKYYSDRFPVDVEGISSRHDLILNPPGTWILESVKEGVA